MSCDMSVCTTHASTPFPMLQHSFDGPYLGFEPVTLVPYEPKLIDLHMLSNEQEKPPPVHPTEIQTSISLSLAVKLQHDKRIQWLNDYNAKVIEKVGAELKLQRRMKGFHWLLSKTIYIPAHGATSGVEEENQQRPRIVMLLPYSEKTVATPASWSARRSDDRWYPCQPEETGISLFGAFIPVFCLQQTTASNTFCCKCDQDSGTKYQPSIVWPTLRNKVPAPSGVANTQEQSTSPQWCGQHSGTKYQPPVVWTTLRNKVPAPSSVTNTQEQDTSPH
uniref:Peptidase M24 C-terminal domain-containing protein n=2 Tax=Timema TaxID=61471 RepID=A0A7R9DCH0_TIMPO|nr:unnamed protein product [Timema poppensis]